MQPRLDRVLCVFLLLTTVRAFAGDDDNKPAPRFRAKTTSGESFNNESVKGQSRSARVLDHLVPVLSPGGAASRGHQPGARRQGTDRSRHRCCRIQENGQEISRTASRACRIVLTEDTNLAAMYQANSYPIYGVIDRGGNIAGEQRGAAGEKALRRLLASADMESPTPDGDNADQDKSDDK